MSSIPNLIKSEGLNLKTLYTIIKNNRYTHGLKKRYYFLLQIINPKYTYDETYYPNVFISNTKYMPNPPFQKSKKIIYCFWTGNNEMSDNRKRSLDSLKSITNVEVCLITPKNLAQYILPEAPLHPAYKYLSLVHKSDYLRCYFMHFYGGGYSDIKGAHYDWNPFFEELNKNKDKVILGSTEKSHRGIAHVTGKIKKDLEHNYLKIISTQAYVCKPKTMFTQEWYTELLHRMDLYHESLQKYPGNERGNNVGYPIPWTNILGDIFHPLCLKYHKYIIHEPKIMPDNRNYL